MAPNSRPPLTSRIRASFEGRRKSFEGTRKLSKSGRTTTADSNNASQEVRSPTTIDSEVNSPLHTNGFITQDPQSIRHAVDQAINGEAFQNAIAANLAKLIKPSIKSALDTIQPVVEAVYSHELLLRKTNQSVEDVLSRMDTNAETAAARRESFIDSTYVAPGTPANGEKSADAVEGTVISRGPGGPNFNQFKQLMEEHNAKTLATISESIESNTTKIAELAQGVSDIDASIGPTKESIDFLKSASEQATTTSSVLQAQLDQLKADIGQIIEAIGADLGKNIQAISEKSGAASAELISSHTTKLDLISTDLAALKGHADTVEKIDVISSELVALKASVETGNAANSEGFASVLGAVGEHATSLIDIKEKAPHPDILAALQKSNDSHALHATTLSELKERSLGTAPAPVVSEGGSVDHSAALQTIQADLTALKENIAAGLTNNTDLEAKIDTVLTTIEEQKAGHPGVDILAAVKQSNESHAAHAAALDSLKSSSADVNPELGAQVAGILGKLDEHSATLNEIKSFGGTHTAALEGIKSTTSGSPTAANDLTAQIATIIAKLDTHTAVLDDIKGVSSAATESAPLDNSDLTAQIGAIVTKLDTHAATLDEIKGLSGVHATALESHGTALESIKSVATESVPVDNGDLATQIAAIVAKLDSHGAALDEIKTHTTALESHGSALDEIKTSTVTHTSALENHGAAIAGFKSLSATSTAEYGNSALESQIAAIMATLEGHGSALDDIKESTGTHVNVLESHGTILEDLKSVRASLPAEGTELSALETKISAIIATLEAHGVALDEIKTTSGSHSSVLDEIKTFGTTHAAALECHGTVLENIKSRSVESASTESGYAALEGQMTDLVAKLESHTAVLDEIKASTGSHSLLLDEIKLAGTTHADALEAIKSPALPAIPAADPSNLAALEIQIGSIISTLETHSAAWNEIKARSDPISTGVVPTEPGSRSSTPEGPFTTIIETLMLHTSLLNEIKEDVSAEILTSLHDMGQVQANQTNLLTEIREADLDDEILTLLHASSESHGNHSSALDKIHAAVLVSNESHAAHTTSLDEIKSRSVEPVTSSGEAPDMGDLKEKISSIAEKLEEYSITLSTIKDATAASNDSHAAHATSLDEIKSRSVDAPADGGNIGALETQIGGIVTKLEDHTAALSAIKVATSMSNDSHTSHATILGEIKEAALASNESHTAHAATLTEIKDKIASSSEIHAAHAVVLSEIKDATLASKDLHAVHATSLTELRETTLGFHDNHAASLSEIKDVTLASKDAHASHTAAFAELKSIQPASTPVQESTDLSALEAHITSIINTLEGQTTALSSIKEGTTTANPEILSAIQASNDLLTSHGQLIESIKEGTSHTDILANISELKSIVEDSKAETLSYGALVKDLHTETKDSHSNLASAIGALALGGAAGAGATALLTKDDDSSTAVLDEVKAVRALIETSATSIDATKEKLSSLVSQIDINHTTITTSISTLGDEIKSEIDASGTGVVESISALDGNVKAINLSPLSSSLEQHGADIKSLSAQLETLDGNLKENTTHITSLHNGVHLNDTGVGQLKDHGISRSVAKEPTTIPEGAWFGSARSGSRSPTLSRVVSRSFVEPVQEVAEETLPSTEETVVESEPEPAVEEQPVSKRVEIAEDLLKAEEVVEAESLPGDSLVVDEPIAEPETVSEIVDMQPSTEEPAIEPEVLLDDQPASREIDEASLDTELPKPKAEEAVEADRVLDDSVGIDDADSSAKEPAIESEVSQDQLPETNDVGAPEDLPEAEEVAEGLTATGSLVDENSQGLPIDLSDSVQDVTSNNEGPAPSNEESMPVEEISVPNELDQPEGTEPVELELQSGEVAVTDGSAPEFREDHTSTIIETSTVEEESVQGEDLPAESIEKDNLPSSPVPGDDEFSAKSPDESPLEPEHEEEKADELVNSPLTAHHLDDQEADLSIVTPGSSIQDTRGEGSDFHSSVLEHEPGPSTQAPGSPLSTPEVVQPSSPFIESPIVSRDLDERLASSPLEHASSIPPAHQTLLGDRGLDSGHATPRDEARSNPFEDSDNMMSPSSAVSPKSVLSPEAEVDAPLFPAPDRTVSIDEGGLRSSFPGTDQHASQHRFEDSDDPMSPASGYDAHGLPHMVQESPIQSRPFETNDIPSSPQFEHQSAAQPRVLQHESSFDYQQENYEPALLPHNFDGQPPAFEDDDFSSPRDDRVASSDIRPRSPLQPLQDDDFRAGQYERYSPEQRSPVEEHRFDDTHGALPPHLQLGSSFPAAGERSPIQPLEDEDYQSPRHQGGSPEPVVSDRRQYSPPSTPPPHGTLPPHLQLDTPAFRSTSPPDPYGERDDEVVSPSSEFAVPITPALATQPTTSSAQNPLSPESEVEEPSFPTEGSKGKAIASPALMSPDLGSPAEFGFSREETEKEPESALASPTSPAFSEGGTIVEKSGGKKKKGKKEKKEKGGGKKGKKEKVPFEMEGEDAE
ncbi:hypothetical protein ACEPPN_016042 [Leptodophora sp. 'Broadleaf-Isolate-01']